ncbi:hypothetical protein [Roseibium sp.]|uniref:hypothetical protein n=1 Tax=Roseibium sp. TaxID=1936156 RepID=UPI003D0A0B4A
MLSTDLIQLGYMCKTAAQTDELDRLQEFTKRIGSQLIEAAERAQGMESLPAIIPAPSGHVVIDLCDDKIIPFPKARLRAVPTNDGGAA